MSPLIEGLASFGQRTPEEKKVSDGVFSALGSEFDAESKSVLNAPLHSVRSETAYTIQNEQAWHRTAAVLIASGTPLHQVAEAVGRSKPTVSAAMRTDWFRSLIAKIIHEQLHESKALDLLSANIGIAAATLIELTQFGKTESVRLQSANAMLDRVFGRAANGKNSDGQNQTGKALDHSVNELKEDIRRLQEETNL